jgi:UDP-sulfoquinovose synthase
MFAFRKASTQLWQQRLFGATFAFSSLVTPFFLGTVAGAIASGRVPPGIAAGDLVGSWVNPTAIASGALAVVTAAYLAAVYLTRDAERAGDATLVSEFRRRALGTGMVVGVLSAVGLVVLAADAPELFAELTTGRALPFLLISVLSGLASLLLLWRGAYVAVRLTAAVAVTGLLWGWGVGQYPELLLPVCRSRTPPRPTRPSPRASVSWAWARCCWCRRCGGCTRRSSASAVWTLRDRRRATAPAHVHERATLCPLGQPLSFPAVEQPRFRVCGTQYREEPRVRTLVLGGDGYLGWPTALHLSAAGHEVALVDSFVRRQYDAELGVDSLVPIASMRTRLRAWEGVSGKRLHLYVGDLTDADFTEHLVRDFGPDAIVHFAEQRAAPYSMIGRRHAVYTQVNNVVGTLNLLYAIADVDPSIALVKLGTMGEYGTPNIDIEEGWLDVTHNGRSDRVLFPKRPGSFYHLSKVHDSHNIEFTCRAWGLRATDLNQGVVYGVHTPQTEMDPRLTTRYDYDHVFGTVLNRFVIQAVLGHPLTVYGSGGQTRGFIDIRDTVECIRLAVENPPEAGEFRVFNQMTECHTVRDLAKTVADVFPRAVEVEYLDNPRVEQGEHYYNVVHTRLQDLGLQAHLLSSTLIESLFDVVEQHKDRVDPTVMRPSVRWGHTTSKVQ